MSIIFDYKWYFFLFCILLGLIYALGFYFKNKDSILSTKATIALGVLRFCSASLLAFLFLSPLVKQKLTHKEKPIIIIGQDNSASLLYCKDSAFYKGEYQTLLSNTIADLQKDYEVHSYLFGQSTKTGNEITFTDNKTDISNFVDEIKPLYQPQRWSHSTSQRWYLQQRNTTNKQYRQATTAHIYHSYGRHNKPKRCYYIPLKI